MFDVRYSSQFKKDLKRCKKRNYDLDELKYVVDKLRAPSILEEKYRDHNLLGDQKNYRECHVKPDWLLLYRYEKDVLLLGRTGTHSDIFEV
mgnify:CR=1 FL=1